MAYPAKKNASFTTYVSLPDASDVLSMRANPTLAAGDVKVATDDGAPANITTLPVVDADFTKRVKVVLSSTEMNGDAITLIFSDQTSPKEWGDVSLTIHTSVRNLDDLAFPNTSGRGIDVDASGGVEVGAFQANAITAAALATDAGTEIATAVWANATRELTSGNNIALAKGVGVTGFNDIAAGTAMTLTSGERTAVANEVEAQIIDDTDSEKVLTAITDKIAAVNPDLSGLTISAIASGVRTELGTELGRIDAAISSRSSHTAADIWSVATRVLTAGTNIVLSKGTGITGFNDLSAAQVNAEVDTAISDAALASLATAIKSQTDQLVFTATGLDANLISVTGVAVTGSGTEGDPWGPGS